MDEMVTTQSDPVPVIHLSYWPDGKQKVACGRTVAVHTANTAENCGGNCARERGKNVNRLLKPHGKTFHYILQAPVSSPHLCYPSRSNPFPIQRRHSVHSVSINATLAIVWDLCLCLCLQSKSKSLNQSYFQS